MHNLTIWDLVLAPIYFLILRTVAMRYRDKLYPRGHPLRPFYLKGLYLKFAGAIFIALIYEFYYGGGDTYNYFNESKIVNSALGDSVGTWFDLIRRASEYSNPKLYNYVEPMAFYDDPSSFVVVRISSLLGLLNGTSYIPIALLFAYISYSGIWAMYRTFANLYPHLYKQLAIAFLFVPSTIVWGSAIFKDTICMFGLGWLTYTTFRVFVDKDLSFKNLFLLALSFYLIAVVKVYILLAFMPALGLWLLMNYSKKITSPGLRWLVNVLFVSVSLGAFFFFAGRFAQQLNDYSLENIAQKAKYTQGWIKYVSTTEEGSAYDLGNFDPTPVGMLSKFPQAVVVTLFRPFLWEARKPIMMLSALESFAFLAFTFMIFRKYGIAKTLRRVIKDPNLLFFFSFSIIFAFAVGISTGNFGTLSRYKIPCMPFFAALLVVLYYQQNVAFVKIIKNVPTKKRPAYPVA